MTKLSNASARSIVYEYYILVCRPYDGSVGSVMVIPQPPVSDGSSSGWTLPWFQQKERHFWQEVSHVNQGVADLLGLRAVTLRCLHTDYDPTLDRVRTVYAVEQVDVDWSPPHGARWISTSDLVTPARGEAAIPTVAGQPFAQPIVAHAVADWFAAPQTKQTGAEWVGWYELGWFAKAEAWIQQVMDRLGRHLTGPVVQVRSWQRSCLLRMETSDGPAYFKAVPQMFGHEPAVTHALSSRYPRHIPQVLARHPKQPWFLMQAVSGTSLETRQDLAAWERSVRIFALIQIDLIKRTDRLQDLGCPLRPLESLVDGLEALLADEPLLLPGRPAGLGPEEVATIRGMVPALRAKAQRLAEIKLPLTLEHGDFWPGQVLVVPEISAATGRATGDPGSDRSALQGPQPVFLDWSDCSIAHPFFSLSFFDDIMEMEGFLPDVADLRERLRTAYLGPWTTFAPMPDLVEAFELARPLAAVHNAIIYQQQILPGTAQPWEMHYMLPFFLKKLLRNYDRAVVV